MLVLRSESRDLPLFNAARVTLRYDGSGMLGWYPDNLIPLAGRCARRYWHRLSSDTRRYLNQAFHDVNGIIVSARRNGEGRAFDNCRNHRRIHLEMRDLLLVDLE